MPSPLDALETSVDHLRDLIEPMDESQFVASAYPTEWTVADVMSHLGSGAIISKRRIDDSLEERETPSEFNQSVWDVWNAKTPHAQVTDALDADRALLTRLLEMTPEERARYTLSLGPMTFDFEGAVRLRLGEHAVHTWDIEESLDAQADPVARSRAVPDRQSRSRHSDSPPSPSRPGTCCASERPIPSANWR